MEALKMLENRGFTVFAGGTDLTVKRRIWSGVEIEFEGPVIFISDIKELKEVSSKDGYLNIGAACTCSEIIENPLTPDFMSDAFLQMASPAIRNLATIGGNICNSSPAGDSLPILYGLDASLILQSFKETREVPIEKFILGPGRNIITEHEMLTEIKIPIKTFDKVCYRKVGTRKSTALSKISFMGLADIKDGTIWDVRIALGAVGPTVVRDKGIEREIVRMSSQDKKLDIGKIRSMYGEAIKPIDDQRSTAAYRKEVSLRLIEGFLAGG